MALSLLRSNLTAGMADRSERLALAALLFGASLMLAISTMGVLLAALWIWLTRHMASDSAALIIGVILLVATIGMAFWAKYLLHSHPKRAISNPTNLPIPEWALELFAMVKPHLSEAVIASLIAGWAAGRSRKD